MLLIERWLLPADMTASVAVEVVREKEERMTGKELRPQPCITLGFWCPACKAASPSHSVTIARLLTSAARRGTIVDKVLPFFAAHPHQKQCILMLWWPDERQFAKQSFAQIMATGIVA